MTADALSDPPDGWTEPHPACVPVEETSNPRRLLAELVSTPSVSGAERAVAERLVTWFESHGRTARIDETGNVRAPADDTVLLTGHLDTVPGALAVGVRRVPNDRAAWGGEAIGSHAVAELTGRGSVDATGPLAAGAVAAVATGVSFAGVVREETDSAGARFLIDDRAEPEAVVNGEPSGWNAVTFGYRGLVRATYSVEQPASHGASPEPTAIDRATAWWERVRETIAADGPVVERPSATATAIDGGRTADGHATSARIEATFRVPLDATPSALRETITGCTNHGSLTWHESIPPVETSRRGPLSRAFRAAIRAAGGEPRELRKTGTADTNLYAAAWDCPVVTYGPGDSALDHTPDERLPLPAFDNATAVLCRVVSRLLDR